MPVPTCPLSAIMFAGLFEGLVGRVKIHHARTLQPLRATRCEPAGLLWPSPRAGCPISVSRPKSRTYRDTWITSELRCFPASELSVCRLHSTQTNPEVKMAEGTRSAPIHILGEKKPYARRSAQTVVQGMPAAGRHGYIHFRLS